MSVIQPVPFIVQDPKKPTHFIIDPAARKLLSSIRVPICPVIVAGPYRSGKSTLLNLLLAEQSQSKKAKGFAVGSTVQACTKGIWLWGEPIMIGDGANQRAVLLLDSEGLGSIGKETTFDVQIFSLSILLSSLFVLNTSGPITESALEQLELVVQMTQRVKVREDQNQNQSSNQSDEDSLRALSAFMPEFMWVLRDFSLELTDEHGQPITARQYLEAALRPVQTDRPRASISEKNRIRSVLSSVFIHRDCIPLVRPITDEKALQKLSSLDRKQLRPEFLSEMDALRSRVYNTARVKSVEGTAINGPAYCALADQYVAAINTGSIPVIHSAWQSVVKLQATQALDQAAHYFTTEVNRQTASIESSRQPMNDAQLTVFLDNISDKSHDILAQEAVGDTTQLRDISRQLDERIADLSQNIRSINQLIADQFSRSLIEQVWSAANGDAAVQSIEDAITWLEFQQHLLNNYNLASNGLGVEAVARRFIEERHKQWTHAFSAKQAQRAKEVEEIKSQLASTSQRLNESAAANTSMSGELHKLKLDIEFAHKQYIAKETELKQLADEKSRVVAAFQERESEMKEELKSSKRALKEVQSASGQREASAKAETDRVKRELKDLQATLSQTESSYKSQISELQHKLSNMQSEKDRLTTETDRVKRELKDLQATLSQTESSQKSQISELQHKLSNMQSENDRLTSIRKELDAKLHSAEHHNKTLETQCAQLTQQLDAQKRSVTEASRNAQTLENQLSKLDVKAQSERESYESRISALNSQLADVQTRMAKIVHQESEAVQLKQKLENEIKHYHQKNQDYEAQIARLNAERVALEQRHHDELAQLRSQQVELNASKRSKRSHSPSPARAEPVEEHNDVDMDNEDDDSEQNFSNPAFSDKPNGSRATQSTRYTLAPRNIRESEGEKPVDPRTLTINELKSWLTELDVDLPMKQQTKSWYVDKLFLSVPELDEMFNKSKDAKPAGRKAKK